MWLSGRSERAYTGSSANVLIYWVTSVISWWSQLLRPTGLQLLHPDQDSVTAVAFWGRSDHWLGHCNACPAVSPCLPWSPFSPGSPLSPVLALLPWHRPRQCHNCGVLRTQWPLARPLQCLSSNELSLTLITSLTCITYLTCISSHTLTQTKTVSQLWCSEDAVSTGSATAMPVQQWALTYLDHLSHLDSAIAMPAMPVLRAHICNV